MITLKNFLEKFVGYNYEIILFDDEKEEELYNNWLNGARKKLSEKELAEEGCQ